MSNVQAWADDEVSDDDVDVGNTAAEIQQDNLLRRVDDKRLDPAPRERRDLKEDGGAGGRGGGSGARRGDGGRGNKSSMDGSRGGRGERGAGGDRDRRRPAATEADVPQTPPFTAYVGNLSFNTTAQVLGEFFQSGNCDVTDVVMAEDEGGRPRGFGHVTFADRQSLVRSLEANNVDLDGRSIKVDIHHRIQSRERGGYGDRAERGERRYREAEPLSKSEAEGSWDRATARVDAKERSHHDKHASSGAAHGEKKTEAPKERPKITIAPRTAPLTEIAAPVAGASVSSIFGEAKPRDASVFDKLTSANPNPAAAGANNKQKVRTERKNAKEGAEVRDTQGEKKEPSKSSEKAREDLSPIQRGQAPPTSVRKEHKEKSNGGSKDKKDASKSKDGSKFVTAGAKSGAKTGGKDKKEGSVTDAQRFEAVQANMAKLATSKSTAKTVNVYAGLLDEDSENESN